MENLCHGGGKQNSCSLKHDDTAFMLSFAVCGYKSVTGNSSNQRSEQNSVPYSQDGQQNKIEVCVLAITKGLVLVEKSISQNYHHMAY